MESSIISRIVAEGVLEYMEDMEDTYIHIGSNYEQLKYEKTQLEDALKNMDFERVNKILELDL